MTRDVESVTVLGLNVALRPDANMERIRRAARYVEDRYEALKTPTSQGRDILLTLLALALADDLLQMKSRLDGERERLARLLVKIDDSLQ